LLETVHQFSDFTFSPAGKIHKLAAVSGVELFFYPPEEPGLLAYNLV
jgi:hypothetical protein